MDEPINNNVAMPDSVLVKVDREELCCHACPLLLDVLIQYLCYARGTVPTLVTEMIATEATGPDTSSFNVQRSDSSPPQGDSYPVNINRPSRRELAQKNFVIAFKELRRSLTEAFRSRNQGKITEVVVVMGNNVTLNFREVYRLNCPDFTRAKEIEFENKENRHSPACDGEGLSRKELHRIATHFHMQSLGFFNPPAPLPRKVAVYLRASRDAELPGFIPKEEFHVPDLNEARKRKIHVVNVNVETSGQSMRESGKEKDLKDDEAIWFASDTVLSGFSL